MSCLDWFLVCCAFGMYLLATLLIVNFFLNFCLFKTLGSLPSVCCKALKSLELGLPFGGISIQLCGIHHSLMFCSPTPGSFLKKKIEGILPIDA